MNIRAMCVGLAVVCGAALAAAPDGGQDPRGGNAAPVWFDENAGIDQAFAANWRATRNAIIDADPTLDRDPTAILVKFARGTPRAHADLMKNFVAGRTVQRWNIVPDVELIAVDGDVNDALSRMNIVGRAIGAVEYAEPDFIYHLGATPDDSFYGLQWGLNNTGQTVANGNDPGTAGADIDANLAWDVTTGSSSFVVGMADSGIRNTHEDLAANIWTNPGEIPGNKIDDDGNGYKDDTWGWDFWNNDNNPLDDNGHGTHTAGTVGAVGNNGKGVAGVAWNVKLVGLKIGSRTGSVSSSAAISAINYCVYKGIKVSNHSWGGTGYSATFDTAVTNARNAGHMIVCAAGNSGVNNETTPFYPASYTQDNIISVASTTNDDTLSSFSNYGATRVDLGAPGENIASTYIQRSANNAYVYLSGTSMAAPHVTGVAALIWSQNPTWTYAQVRSKILSTVRPIPALSGKCVTGGVLNANGAVH